MPKLIDKIKLEAMVNTGMSRKQIAERLECSDRQIRRILGPIKAREDKPIHETETALREYYLQYESGDAASARFGISRQAIFKGGR